MGTRTLGTDSSWSASEHFNYQAGSAVADRTEALTFGSLPALSESREDFSYRRTDIGPTPAVTTRRDREHNWTFSTVVTLATSSASPSATMIDQKWLATDLDTRVDRVTSGTDQRVRTTTDRTRTSWGQNADQEATLSWSQQRTIDARHSWDWTGSAGGVTTVVETRDEVGNSGRQSVASSGTVYGEFRRSAISRATTTVQATCALGPVSLAQTRVTTVSNALRTEFDHLGAAVTGTTSTAKSVSIDTLSDRIEDLSFNQPSAAISLSRTGTSRLGTRTMRQYFENQTTPRGSSTASTHAEATVDRVDQTWSDSTSDVARGTVASGDRATTLAITRVVSDSGSSTTSRVWNSQSDSTATPQVPGYSQLIANSTYVAGSGAGTTDWVSSTIINLSTTGTLLPGLTITTQAMSNSSDAGTGSYSRSFSETSTTDSTGTTSTNGWFNSSTDYAGSLLFQRSATTQVQGLLSDGPGHSSIVDTRKTLRHDGSEAYSGSTRGIGESDASGISLSLTAESLVVDLYTFSGSDTESIVTRERRPGFSGPARQMASDSRAGTGRAVFTTQLTALRTNETTSYEKRSTEETAVHGTTRSNESRFSATRALSAGDSWRSSQSQDATSTRSGQGTFSIAGASTTIETGTGTTRTSSATNISAETYNTDASTTTTADSLVIGSQSFEFSQLTSSSSTNGVGSYSHTSTTSSTNGAESAVIEDNFSEAGNTNSHQQTESRASHGPSDGGISGGGSSAVVQTPGFGLNSSTVQSSTQSNEAGTYSRSGSSLSERAGMTASSNQLGHESSAGTTSSVTTTSSIATSHLAGMGFLNFASETNFTVRSQDGFYERSSEFQRTDGVVGKTDIAHAEQSKQTTGTTQFSGESLDIQRFDSAAMGGSTADALNFTSRRSSAVWTGGSNDQT
ncbi:MAG: hypothetical protein ACK5EA_10355, partial [Planctomycetaceae bacterium]